MVHFYFNGVWRAWGLNYGPALLAEARDIEFHLKISLTTHKIYLIKRVLMVMFLSYSANDKQLFSFRFYVLSFISA